ncbi:MAG: hypothetical protein HQM10_25990 [Candidatus Riflebacteria bacterium]|nr:hypothetical protein [Candidatus Riflebacteria bacterium]
MKRIYLFTFLVCFSLLPLFAEEAINSQVQEMMTIYSQNSQKAQSPAFKEKVNEIDELLRKNLEIDQDVKAFETLLDTAEKFVSRKAARGMFEPALSRASKRLEFAGAHNETPNPEFLNKCKELKGRIDAYLDPNAPDLDTVDREGLESKRKSLEKEALKTFSILRKMPEKDVYQLTVMGEDGLPGKLSSLHESSILGKIKTLVPSAKAAKIDVVLTKERTINLKALISDFAAPNGFVIQEAELEFEGIPLDSLNDSNPNEYTGVFDNSTFKRYRTVYNQEQVNSFPFLNNVSYDMESVPAGNTFKIPFVKLSGISETIKSLEGDTRFQVVNGAQAINEKALELKNTGESDIIFIQGTEQTGIFSVKALGSYTTKDGCLAFSEILLLVDDQVSSDVTKFLGSQAINFAMKQAYEKMRKAYPFTMYLEKVQVENDDKGNKSFIFSGRGKYVTQ